MSESTFGLGPHAAHRIGAEDGKGGSIKVLNATDYLVVLTIEGKDSELRFTVDEVQSTDRLGWLCSLGLYVQEDSALRPDKWVVLDVDHEIHSRGTTPAEAVDKLRHQYEAAEARQDPASRQAQPIPLELTPHQEDVLAERAITSGILVCPAGDSHKPCWVRVSEIIKGSDGIERVQGEPVDILQGHMRLASWRALEKRRKPKDPTKKEMLELLAKEWPNNTAEQLHLLNCEVAMYWFANHYHGGQASNLYSVLSTSAYRPGPLMTLEKEDEEIQSLHQVLVENYGGTK